MPAPHQVAIEIWNTTGKIALASKGTFLERVQKTLANRQLPLPTDAAAKQNPRRAIRTRGQHDGSRAQLAGSRCDPDRAVAVQQHAIDERFG